MHTIQKFATPISIVIAGVFIGAGLFFSGGSSTGTPSAKAPSVDIAKVSIKSDDPFVGKKDAPVTIAYWSDYQCPFCKAVEVGGIPQIPIDPAIPQIIKKYVDAGVVRIVFKDYAFLGDDSLVAAQYEHAVWDTYPDKFYAWREAMFKAQDDEGDEGFGDEASILKLTKTIPGLDAAKLQALVAKNKSEYLAKIQADIQEGSGFGVQGTPAFIVGKKFIGGAEQFPAFEAAIAEAQKTSGGLKLW